MRREAEEHTREGELQAEANFKDLVFANNPKLYEALFGFDEVTDEELEAEDFGWIQPQNENEARALLDDLQAIME